MASGKIPVHLEEGKETLEISKGDFINQKATAYINCISAKGISKWYTVKDNNKLLELQIPLTHTFLPF